MPIETEEHAARLARAICNDVLLYNRDGLEAGRDISEAIEDGRRLYRERVAERLQPIFEQVLAASALGAPREAIEARRAFEPPAAPHPPMPERSAPRSSARPAVLIGIGIVVLVGAAVGAWLAMGR